MNNVPKDRDTLQDALADIAAGQQKLQTWIEGRGGVLLSRLEYTQGLLRFMRTLDWNALNEKYPGEGFERVAQWLDNIGAE